MTRAVLPACGQAPPGVERRVANPEITAKLTLFKKHPSQEYQQEGWATWLLVSSSLYEMLFVPTGKFAGRMLEVGEIDA